MTAGATSPRTAASGADATTGAAPSTWSVLRTVIRRGPGPAAGVLTLVMCTLHVVLRSTWWRYEWTWAWYQFHFGTLLIGPVVSGVAFAWGATWHPTRPLVAAANRFGATTAVVAASIVLPVVAAYLAVLAGVSAVVFATTGLVPDGITVATLGPPLGLLVLCIALGCAAGSVIGRPTLAPLWAIGVFVLLMTTYMVIPDRFAKVGGATASLLGLRPRASIQVGQVLEFVGLAAVVLALASLPRRSGRACAVAAGGIVVALLGVGVLAVAPTNEFERVGFAVTCRGSAPQLCLADGWAAADGDLRAPLARYDRSLAAAGLPRIGPYTQQVPVPPGAVFLDPAFVLRYSGDGPADGLIINELIPLECNDEWDGEVTDAVGLIEAYLADAWDADGRLHVSEADRDRLAEALRVIRSCRR